MIGIIKAILVLFIGVLGATLTFFGCYGLGIPQSIAVIIAPIGGVAWFYVVRAIIFKLGFTREPF